LNLKELGDLKGKRILVVGLGLTGVKTARFLIEKKAIVTISEKKPKEKLYQQLMELNGKKFTLESGGHKIATFLQNDFIVLSPGVPKDISPLVCAKKAGIEILSEIELAARFIKTPIIAITGTNGKTTTTTLINQIFLNSGKKTFLGGNIGNPLIEYLASPELKDYLVLEISSFQLEDIKTFRPYISVILNITPDHLDRYPSFEDYIKAKAKIFMNQNKNDFLILNGDDAGTKSFIGKTGIQEALFSAKDGTKIKAFLQDNNICYKNGTNNIITFSLSRFRLPGLHNIENAMSAVLVAMLLDCPMEVIQKTINNFRNLKHRLEFVKRIRSVKFYNDSKSTNVDSLKRSLQSFKKNIILIAGGRDKGGDFSILKPLIREKVKFLILFGEAKNLIHFELKSETATQIFDDLEECVHFAFLKAQTNDIVLFSPGCASFDMFNDYEHRGNYFKKIVKELKG
jgi:UDP-N-acetylmuramoylalanine--D-glutamate ligase